MNGVRSIYIDELPVRCIRQIRLFYKRNGAGKLPLAIKELSKSNRRLWQIYFHSHEAAERLLNNDLQGRFYLVDRQIQHSLPFEWAEKEV